MLNSIASAPPDFGPGEISPRTERTPPREPAPKGATRFHPQPAESVGFLPPGSALCEYRIEKVLGHGGFGITYLARDTHLDKPVAIKEYLPTDLAFRSGTQVSVRTAAEQPAFNWGMKQFLQEAKTLARFSHPNLVPVHRFFQANRTAYFVMSYAEGETLSGLLKREPEITEARVRSVLLPLLEGLEVVHHAGILHRDIKPENILLRRDGSPVLIDFGAARLNLGSRTRSIMCALTAGYAPLEQYASDGNQGPWTDVYALGAVAYRAIAGRKPPEAVNRIHDDPLIPAAMAGFGRFSPAFLRAVDWALAVDPEDRPRTVAEFRRALDGEATPPAPAASATRSARASVSRAAPVAAPGKRAWGSLLSATSSLVAIALTILPFASLRGSSAEPAPIAPPATPLAAAVPAATPVAALPAAAIVAVAPKARPAAHRDVASAEPELKPVARMEPLSSFQDCHDCPVMVALSGGAFRMGGAHAWEQPRHEVALKQAFAIGRYEVTVAEWQLCVKAGDCSARGGSAGLPVVNVSWKEATAYTAWLSRLSGRHYRLPSEAEWEYAARAGTATDRYWGDEPGRQCAYANGADQGGRWLKKTGGTAKPDIAPCSDGRAALATVGSFRPNWFDLYDMAGNAWEWTLDCWRDSYRGASPDGTAAAAGACTTRVIRGGSWRSGPGSVSSASRSPGNATQRSDNTGFRVVAD